MRRVFIESGERFGDWEVIQRGSGSVLCRCKCGTVRKVDVSNMKRGGSKNCGCTRAEAAARKTRSIEGISVSRLPVYHVWAQMIQRCTTPTDRKYRDYGARGISVCERWMNSFVEFIRDMGERPPGMTLDRIDVNGNYEPSNCRWATTKQQSRNKRNNAVVFVDGVRMCQCEAAIAIGVPQPTLSRWMRKKIDPRGILAERKVICA